MYFKYISLHSRVRVVINVILQNVASCDKIIFTNKTLRLLSFKTSSQISSKSEQFISSHNKDEREISLTEFIVQFNYYREIKDNLNNNDLSAAKKVLYQMESNNIVPATDLFRLVMKAYALQGRDKDCFEILDKMLGLNIEPSPMIFATLIISLLAGTNKKIALSKLRDIMDIISSRNVPVDATIYIALIKFYHKFKLSDEALRVYDRLRQNNQTIDLISLGNLLGCINVSSNNTLELNLVLWHTVQKNYTMIDKKVHVQFWRNISKASCKFTRLSGVISRGNDSIDIKLVESGDSDLLASPPVVSRSSLSKFANVEDLGLRDIFEEDKLLLFGGYPKVLLRILSDGIELDSQIFCVLLRCLPMSDFAEDQYITHVKQYNVQLDTPFWNGLMKRRCLRFDYESAKNTLMIMEAHGAKPNMSTWQVLALTCHSHDDIEQYLYTLEKYGCKMNAKAVETLIQNLLYHGKNNKNVFFVLYNLMSYMEEHQIRPAKEMILKIDQFLKIQEDSIKQGKYEFRWVQLVQFQKFVRFHEKWKSKFNY